MSHGLELLAHITVSNAVPKPVCVAAGLMMLTAIPESCNSTRNASLIPCNANFAHSNTAG